MEGTGTEWLGRDRGRNKQDRGGTPGQTPARLLPEHALLPTALPLPTMWWWVWGMAFRQGLDRKAWPWQPHALGD